MLSIVSYVVPDVTNQLKLIKYDNIYNSVVFKYFMSYNWSSILETVLTKSVVPKSPTYKLLLSEVN